MSKEMENEMENEMEQQEVNSTEENVAENPQAEESNNAEEVNNESEEVNNETEDSEKEALKKAAEEHYQRYLRTQADFDNFRRRTRQEKEEFAKSASQSLIERLLPIVDNFERAIAASRENSDFEALAKGVDMIARQLVQVLEAEGLKAIEAVGQPFDPEQHQAVMTVEAEDGQESGIVVEELQKGYKLKDKVIRPSMVKVSG